MNNLHPLQKRLVKSVRAEFERINSDIRTDKLKRQVSAEERNLIVAQNVLRTCIEATLERLLPYSPATPIDLAVRLASYCISALPIEAQEGAVNGLGDILKQVHGARVAGGIRLSTTWDMPGQGERDNVPEKNS